VPANTALSVSGTVVAAGDVSLWINEGNNSFVETISAGEVFNKTWSAQVSPRETLIRVRIPNSPPATVRMTATAGSSLGVCSPLSPKETTGTNCAAKHAAENQGAVADPVNTATGNFNESFADISIPGRGPGIALSHAYNSLQAVPNGTLAPEDGPLGVGWTQSYDAHLSFAPSGVVTVHQETGAELAMYPDGNGGFEAPPRAVASLKAVTVNSITTYEFKRCNSTIMVFSVPDASGTARLLSIADRNGNSTTLQYDGSGKLSTVTDAASRKIHFYWTGNHITTVSDRPLPDGNARKVSFGYNDAAGNLTDYTDVGGANWHFTYDGHLLRTMRRPNQATAATPKVTENIYDAAGRVTAQIDELNRRTDIDYTSIPNATKATAPVPGPGVDRAVTVETYQSLVRTSITRAYGTTGASTWTFETDPYTLGITKVTDPLNNVTRAVYDRNGNMTSSTNALGHGSSATYNGFDDPVTVTDRNGVKTTYGYDANGNLTSVSRPLLNASGATIATQRTAFAVDTAPATAGDVTSVTDPRDKVWLQQGFNAAGQPTRRVDPLGNTTRYGIDAATGWLTSEVSSRGSAAGVVAGCTPPALGCTTVLRDAFGRATTVTDANGHASTNHYDADGNLDQSVDADLNPTTFVYDAADQRTEVRRADSPQTILRTAYYGDGSVKTTTDGANHITKYTYDGQGRLRTVTDPDDRTATYGYDPAGNLVTKADHGGTCPTWPIAPSLVMSPGAKCTLLRYDAADRLTSMTYSDGVTPNVTSVVYDNSGRRTAMTTGGVTSRWSWDSLGRLTSTSTDGVDNTVSYAYANLRDPATSITYPGTPARTLVRSYDDAGNMVTETDWLGNVTSFEPDADANLARTVFPPASGLSDTYAYDNADQLQSITAKSGSTTRSSLTYGRDDAGQVTSVSSTGAPADNRSYTYTALNQLKNDGPATDYGYDAADNLRVWADATTQSFDPANQLTSTAGPASQSWGLNSDVAVPADYDGDGKADLAVWRSGTWYVLNSTGGTTTVSLGVPGDVPVPADYDGDGRADMAVFRPAVGGWYLRYATGTTATTYWGQSGDVAAPADYDGDGKADIALWRPSSATWLVLKSSGGTSSTAWGIGGTTPDTPVPADYDGDAKADIAVWRPSAGPGTSSNPRTPRRR
jgi:YD repeat-containing protein